MGHSINLAKNKVMTNIKNLETLKLDGAKIEQVEEYTYLGLTLSFDDKTEKELKIRRANGWKSFWAQKVILKSKLKLKSKIRIFESTIIPVLTYGAQTWATTKKQIRKIQVFQNSMLRNILGVKLKDKMNLDEIYLKTRAKWVGVIARTLKFRYAGHLVRENNQKWNKTLTTWVPHMGKWKRGRPKTR